MHFDIADKQMQGRRVFSWVVRCSLTCAICVAGYACDAYDRDPYGVEYIGADGGADSLQNRPGDARDNSDGLLDVRLACDVDAKADCHCDFEESSEGVCSKGRKTAEGECIAPVDFNDEDICDELDNDCDGRVDEDCTGCTPTCGEGSRCIGETCVETACRDGLDNDMDDLLDCADPDCPGCNSGATCEQSEGRCKEEDCGDGLDNDGDGAIDCADEDCPECEAGTTCDVSTGTCGESDCADGEDNDGDGDVDCEDEDCNGRSCGAGLACSGESCVESNCRDGEDNDGDGKVDCADPDCSGRSCGAGTGASCNFMTTSCEETDCGDGKDNDGDEDVDCEDSDCDGVSCGSGQTCSNEECRETACSDGIDNDGDGDIDACDEDCDRSCTDGASCESGVCTETDCDDGTDNDGDGMSDCADPDCAGKACGDGSGAICHDRTCSEIACEDGFDNDQDGSIDGNDEDCDQSGLEWCRDDSQCAIGVCVGNQQCAQTIVATSKTVYRGSLNGLSGADSKCQSLVGNQRPGTWKAVLSTSTTNAKTRLRVQTEVYNSDGARVASSKPDLWNGSLDNRVQYDEFGSSVTGSAWTGTKGNGVSDPCRNSSNFCACDDWKTSSSTNSGTSGNVTQNDSEWLEADETSCDSGLRLYCLDGQ